MSKGFHALKESYTHNWHTQSSLHVLLRSTSFFFFFFLFFFPFGQWRHVQYILVMPPDVDVLPHTSCSRASLGVRVVARRHRPSAAGPVWCSELPVWGPEGALRSSLRPLIVLWLQGCKCGKRGVCHLSNLVRHTTHKNGGLSLLCEVQFAPRAGNVGTLRQTAVGTTSARPRSGMCGTSWVWFSTDAVQNESA